MLLMLCLWLRKLPRQLVQGLEVTVVCWLLRNNFCEECDATLKTTSILGIHMGLVHNKNGFKCIEYDTANSCEKCDATLKREIEW